MKPGETVTKPFMVRELELKTSQANGNPFLIGKVFDLTGEYKVCIWNDAFFTKDGRAIHDLKPGAIIDAAWKVKDFKGDMQLDVERLIACCAPGDQSMYARSSFVRVSHVTKTMWLALFDEVVHELGCGSSVTRFTRDVVDSSDGFWVAPAAKGMHQNWVGGLAEHTFRLVKTFYAMARLGGPQFASDKVRRDIVLAGLVLHDWGKHLEYKQVAPGVFDYSEFNSLVGHLAGGPILLQPKMIAELTDEDRFAVIHVMLAHHGQLDWGSPIVPATAEAIVVHFLDNLDGKLSMFEEAKHGEWSRGLGTRPFKKQG